MFLGFANFYQRFIQGFSRIAAPLTLMLKTLGSTKSLTRPKKGVVGVGGNSRVGHDRNELNAKKTGNNELNNEIDDEVGKKDLKMSKSKNSFKKLFKSKKTVRSDFFTPKAKLAFTKLR